MYEGSTAAIPKQNAFYQVCQVRQVVIAHSGMQTQISTCLALRSPLIINGSIDRPNLHISCQRKPCEDRAQAARMLCNLICGKSGHLNSSAAEVSGKNAVPAAVVYCVSRVEVKELSAVMQADPRLRGKVCFPHTNVSKWVCKDLSRKRSY